MPSFQGNHWSLLAFGFYFVEVDSSLELFFLLDKSLSLKSVTHCSIYRVRKLLQQKSSFLDLFQASIWNKRSKSRRSQKRRTCLLWASISREKKIKQLFLNSLLISNERCFLLLQQNFFESTPNEAGSKIFPLGLNFLARHLFWHKIAW